MRILKIVVVALPLSLWGLVANAGGDAAAGKAAFEAGCGECHYEDDFSGESEADILAMIQSVKSGEVEHKGEAGGLSDADAANIAAFWASFK